MKGNAQTGQKQKESFMDTVIPDDLKKFIFDNIDTIAELEGLLLFHGNAHIQWNAKSISQRLYISEQESTVLLSKLAARGFLSADEKASYNFQVKQPELAEMVRRLGEIYAQYLVPVTHLVHSKPKSRVQEFADAFRIRKDQS